MSKGSSTSNGCAVLCCAHVTRNNTTLSNNSSDNRRQDQNGNKRNEVEVKKSVFGSVDKVHMKKIKDIVTWSLVNRFLSHVCARVWVGGGCTTEYVSALKLYFNVK